VANKGLTKTCFCASAHERNGEKRLEIARETASGPTLEWWWLVFRNARAEQAITIHFTGRKRGRETGRRYKNEYLYRDGLIADYFSVAAILYWLAAARK
jgi:hypothetical protein